MSDDEQHTRTQTAPVDRAALDRGWIDEALPPVPPMEVMPVPRYLRPVIPRRRKAFEFFETTAMALACLFLVLGSGVLLVWFLLLSQQTGLTHWPKPAPVAKHHHRR